MRYQRGANGRTNGTRSISLRPAAYGTLAPLSTTLWLKKALCFQGVRSGQETLEGLFSPALGRDPGATASPSSSSVTQHATQQFTGSAQGSGRTRPDRRRSGGQALRWRCISSITSARVFGSDSNSPSMELVIAYEFCFWTPRIIMQRCCASITTATPLGFRAS